MDMNSCTQGHGIAQRRSDSAKLPVGPLFPISPANEPVIRLQPQHADIEGRAPAHVVAIDPPKGQAELVKIESGQAGHGGKRSK